MAKKKAAKGKTPAAAKKKTARRKTPTGLVVVQEPVGELVSDPRNARTHDEDNLAAIGASLAKFKQYKPIVANKRNRQVVAGNGTLEAAKRLGWKTIGVVWVDLTPAEQTQMALADNRTAELAGWDDEILADLMVEVQDSDSDLYDALLLSEFEPEQPAEDVPAEAAAALEFQIVVDCKSKRDQVMLLKRFETEGLKCTATDRQRAG